MQAQEALTDHGIKTARRPSVKRSVGYMTGGSLLSTVLVALGGLLIGRLVEPSTLGLFNGISLAITYATFLGLGITAGISRELPYSIGRGDRAHGEQLAAAAQAWTLLMGGVVCAGLLAAAGWYAVQTDWWKTAGWLTNAILALQLFYADYLQMTYRTAHDFGRLSLIKVAQQVALLVLIVLVVPLDFYGLCLRVLLSSGLALALLYHSRPIALGPAWNTLHLRHLLRIGLPIYLVWKVFDYWGVVDQTLVLRLGGTYSLGLYAMVVMVMIAVQTIPQTVGQVLFPRMTESLGRGDGLREVARGYVRPIAFTFAAVVPIVLAAWWLVEPLTQVLIPRYADAIPAMRWALLLGLVACLESGYALFTLGRRQGLRLVAILTGMATYAGSLFWLMQDGFYLSAFPQAFLIGRTTCLVVSYLFIRHILDRENHRE